MSEPSDNNVSRYGRLVELLPVFAALVVHAVAHGRWLLCAPVMVGLLWAAVADVRMEYSPARLLIAGAVGFGAGAGMLWVSEPPTAPFPPNIFGPLCGALVGLSVLCALGRNRYFAWTYACLLVALSMRVREMQAAGWVLLILVVLVTAFGSIDSRGVRNHHHPPFGALFKKLLQDKCAVARRAAADVVSHINERHGILVRCLGAPDSLGGVGDIQHQAVSCSPQHIRKPLGFPFSQTLA